MALSSADLLRFTGIAALVTLGCGGSGSSHGAQQAGGAPNGSAGGSFNTSAGSTGSDDAGIDGVGGSDVGAGGDTGGANAGADTAGQGTGGTNTAGQSSGGAAGTTGGSSSVGGEAGAAGEAGAGGTAGAELWLMPNNEPGLPNQASYDITDEVITDNVTTLMWESMPSVDQYYSVGEGTSYCDGLVLGGLDDWRLPNVVELFSLVDRSRSDPALAPAMPGQFGENDAFITSTLDSMYGNSPWIVRIGGSGNARSQYGESTYRAWCVRGRTDSPPGTYLINEDGTTLDERTGLLWQTIQSPSEVSQAQAAATCGNLSLGGFDDWRLPSAKELFSLYQVDAFASPRLDLEAFPDSTRGPFWASMIGDTVDFALGPSSGPGGTGELTFRCVR